MHAHVHSQTHMDAKVLGGERLPTAGLLKLGCPAVAVDLLPALWQAEPTERPTMEQVPNVLHARAWTSMTIHMCRTTVAQSSKMMLIMNSQD